MWLCLSEAVCLYLCLCCVQGVTLITNIWSNVFFVLGCEKEAAVVLRHNLSLLKTPPSPIYSIVILSSPNPPLPPTQSQNCNTIIIFPCPEWSQRDLKWLCYSWTASDKYDWIIRTFMLNWLLGRFSLGSQCSCVVESCAIKCVFLEKFIYRHLKRSQVHWLITKQFIQKWWKDMAMHWSPNLQLKLRTSQKLPTKKSNSLGLCKPSCCA